MNLIMHSCNTLWSKLCTYIHIWKQAIFK